MPMYYNGDFFGFVFFNSYRKNVFDEEVLHLLDMFAHLISLLVTGELASLRTLISAVHAARNFIHHARYGDWAHLERMARYSRVVAIELAPKYGFDDEYIEHVFLFSPLHDIGKIGIPDSILLKAGLLDTGEREIMKTHAPKGRQLIDSMLRDFGLEPSDISTSFATSRNTTMKPWMAQVIRMGCEVMILQSNPASLLSRIYLMRLPASVLIREPGAQTTLFCNCASLRGASLTPIASRHLSRTGHSWKRSKTASRTPLPPE